MSEYLTTTRCHVQPKKLLKLIDQLMSVGTEMSFKLPNHTMSHATATPLQYDNMDITDDCNVTKHHR